MIKTKVFRAPWIPLKKNITAITLFGLVFTHHPEKINKYILNHEKIHCKQQLEWLYIPFFILYLLEYLWYLIKYRNSDKAYRAISFEKEAYREMHDLDYLNHRRPYQNYRKIKKKNKGSSKSS